MRRRPVPRPSSRSAGAGGSRLTGATDVRISHSGSGVEVGVQHVDDQVHQHEARRDEQHAGLDDRVVALHDPVQDQRPDARQREDLLDDDRAAEQVADLDAGDRDDGDQGVAQRVAVDDRRSTSPLARAVVTYSWRSTSSMLERVIRIRIAMFATASATAGSSSDRKLPRTSWPADV